MDGGTASIADLAAGASAPVATRAAGQCHRVTGSDDAGNAKPDQRPDPRFCTPEAVFFGIGAQKAGTTWLHRYLMQHPEARVPALKETTYWSYVESGRASGWARRRIEDYLTGPSLRARLVRNLGSPYPTLPRSELEMLTRVFEAPPGSHERYADLLFAGAGTSRAVGEISPNYALLSRATFARMAAVAPDVRFFFVMRDPVGRLLSGLRMGLAHGWMARRGLESMEAAIRRCLEPGRFFPVEASRYDKTIGELEAAVPKDRIHYMFYETMFDKGEIDRFAAFLGLSRRPARFAAKVHGGRKFATPPEDRIAALRSLLAPAYDTVRARFGDRVPRAWLA